MSRGNTGLRTWTADLEIDGQTVAATRSDYDLKADQMKSAVAEAREWLSAGAAPGDVVYVQIYKTTLSGTRRDVYRTVSLVRGRIYVQ